MPNNRPVLGALLMSLATLGFAGMATMVKLLDRELPETQLVFWRALFSIPVLVLLLLKAKQALVVKARWTLLMRAAVGFLSMLLFFYSLGRLPLGEAQMLMKLQPVWIALLAPVMLAERAGSRVWLCLGLSLAGVLLVLGPSLSAGVVSVGGLAALGASLFSGLAHLLVRKLGRTEQPGTVVLNFTVLLLLFSGFLAAPSAQLPQGGHWPFLVALSMCAMLGQILMTSAYKVAAAPMVATVGYVSIPVASALDWIIWRTPPTAWAVAGGLLIIGSGVMLAYRERHGQPLTTV